MKKIILLIIAAASSCALIAQQIKPHPGKHSHVTRVDSVVTNTVYASIILGGREGALIKSQLQAMTNADGSPVFDTFTASNRYVNFKFFSANGVSITAQ